jgi:hypothetical protein
MQYAGYLTSFRVRVDQDGVHTLKLGKRWAKYGASVESVVNQFKELGWMEFQDGRHDMGGMIHVSLERPTITGQQRGVVTIVRKA